MRHKYFSCYFYLVMASLPARQLACRPAGVLWCWHKIPRIPTGATWFGIGSLSYGIWSNRNRNVPAGGQQVEEINKIQSDLEIIRQQNDEILRNHGQLA